MDRTQRNENTEIVVGKLCEFFGDKIAAVRVAVCETVSKIISARDIPLDEIRN